jgi:hypothetical protein
MNALPTFPPLSKVKITDFETSFDALPVATPSGEVLWADVRIDYVLPGGLAPQVTIRVPVPYSVNDTADLRRSKALRNARELIDHACRAAGGVDSDDRTREAGGQAGPDASSDTGFQGIAQELGLTSPTTGPD